MHKLQQKSFFNATLFIALYAVFITAKCQNHSENQKLTDSEVHQESIERTRIASERASLLSAYEVQRQACYQKLAVNDCLTQARDAHNEQMRDLKRQDVMLNDVQRKRKAAERLRAVDERNSSQAQLNQAERRGRAIEQAKQREISRAERQKSRDEKATENTVAGQKETILYPLPNLPIPIQSKPRVQIEPKLPMAQRPEQAEKTAQSQQATAQREQDAAERRAKQQQREANRRKPAAASLPVPK
jgi:colicin import membrane protein